jgi:hypothetical protein
MHELIWGQVIWYFNRKLMKIKTYLTVNKTNVHRNIKLKTFDMNFNYFKILKKSYLETNYIKRD